MSGNLAQELDEARAKVAQLERIANAAACHELGRHDWDSTGGCNAGCGRSCHCSVPVQTCLRCGECDYGENAWAEEARRECAERRYQLPGHDETMHGLASLTIRPVVSSQKEPS